MIRIFIFSVHTVLDFPSQWFLICGSGPNRTIRFLASNTELVTVQESPTKKPGTSVVDDVHCPYL